MLVQVFFARQCAFFGRQRFVFKGFEFGRDVALGAFERLAALVFGGQFGQLRGLRVGQLDVVAMHAVVFDFEAGYAGARTLARFEFEQKLPAVGLDGAQFV